MQNDRRGGAQSARGQSEIGAHGLFKVQTIDEGRIERSMASDDLRADGLRRSHSTGEGRVRREPAFVQVQSIAHAK